ncbi:phytoene desaturase family protein [Acetanaerobacterium elongatum]|uniref:Phytoene dehydrogenase-related protein n=1 Tax=Acetanaerobacterium elongatum TaxID=258515 RepID=A0A1G9TZG8_9FIRM|nr:NAD(P)/FAD-dependent oxidoreductase [Acetanaerobacterium elongatum]SDM52665.1 Phytoene dehydrogenase-related protein [Acetanaerobacterium elongatum]
MAKKVIIIGAGLAGLSAGIHLQNNGIESEIFEISGQVGGMCIAWERQGYRFDGCIHWMVGTKKGDNFYNLYREVDALAEDTEIYNSDSITAEIDGVLYEIPLRFEQFKAFLLQLAPQDEKSIEQFCTEVAVFANSSMPTGAPANPAEFFSFLKNNSGFMSLAGKYMNTSVQEYTERFESPLLKKLVFHLMPPEFSYFGLIMMLGTRMSGNAGYPMGGALGVANRMKAKYISLGGKLNMSTRVERIVVENGRVTGIVAKGKTYHCDAVVAACDAYDTLNNMLEGKFRHKQLDEMLKTSPLFDPLVLISFGLNKRFNLPYATDYECPEGLETAPGFTVNGYNLRTFEFDLSAAPEGCSSIMVMTGAPLEYWESLRKTDIEKYRAEKAALAQRVAELLDKRIPGIRESIVVTDVATPATYMRYANLYKGSWEGFVPIPKALRTNIKTSVEGVKGLVLAGQWVNAGGGLCTAVQSGKSAALKIVKNKL